MTLDTQHTDWVVHPRTEMPDESTSARACADSPEEALRTALGYLELTVFTEAYEVYTQPQWDELMSLVGCADDEEAESVVETFSRDRKIPHFKVREVRSLDIRRIN